MSRDGQPFVAGPAPASDSDQSAAGLAPTPVAGARVPSGSPALPWLLIVARGQRQLAAELEALFRGNAHVRVIEDRRDTRDLLPRVARVDNGGSGFQSRVAPGPRAEEGANRGRADEAR